MSDRVDVSSSTGMTPAQRFAATAGGVYLIIGVVGFGATGFSHFASVSGEQLIVFGVNPLHNLVHVLAGASWLWSARSPGLGPRTNVSLGFGFGLLAALGFFGFATILAVEAADADNFLHLATAALALYFGTVGATAARG
ncbi:MAG: DUF4383 domain-containing protein [Actinomycetota bacterium]|nr:DUF4383 domain-containing protein [Actinomycetota bacterium]